MYYYHYAQIYKDPSIHVYLKRINVAFFALFLSVQVSLKELSATILEREIIILQCSGQQEIPIELSEPPLFMNRARVNPPIPSPESI